MLEGTSGDRPGVARTWTALDAGPDIDRRVEREIFGRSGEARRFYSVDDSAAQSVIERVQALLPGARLRCDVESGIFRCEWRMGKTLLGSAAANRSALAVCAASLQACRSGAAVASGQAFRRSAPVWSPAASALSSSGAPRP
jgi:hypothetical protein